MKSPTRRQFLGGATIFLAGCVSPDRGDDTENDTEDVSEELQINGQTLNSHFPLELYEPGTDDRVAFVHWHGDEDRDHWHRMPLDVPIDDWATHEARVNDPDMNQIPVGEDESFHLEVDRVEDTSADLVSVEVTDNFVNFFGNEEGNGHVVFRIVGDEPLWESPTLRVEVSSEL